MGNPIKYLGWIKAKKEDEKALRKLGITGQMNYKDSIFEMCEIPIDKAKEIVPKLKEYLSNFSTVCFTGVDSNGKPVCGMNIDDYTPAFKDEWRRQEYRW